MKRIDAFAPTVPDVHERIRLEAEAVRATPLAPADTEHSPALLVLLEAAMLTIEAAVPASFEYEGKRYWLRCRMVAAALDIHDSPAAGSPLVSVMTEGKWSGHKPGH